MNSTGDHILWHDEQRSIYLLDGPRSIRNAQGQQLNEHGYTLLSSSPVEEPFAGQEPKSEKARARVRQTSSSHELHGQYADLLSDALLRIRTAYNGPWLLTRFTGELQDLSTDDSSTARDRGFITPTSVTSCCIQPVSFDGKSDEADTIELQWPYISNEYERLTELLVGEDKPLRFFLPPNATFMLADCADSKLVQSFHTHLRDQASDAQTPWRFDSIIMDPPWSNRSVKRKRSSYETAKIPHIADMLHSMDLDRLMARECLVGVWITNKEAVRETVLGNDGLFQAWGVDLIAEWIWLKVTTRGEPISAIDALWRKPYEILLLGRRRNILQPQPIFQLDRRVLISVPDVHSRKPCLKDLIELMLPTKHRVLEVFARHLVGEWWSWGNECIKFNDIRHWQDDESSKSAI